MKQSGVRSDHVTLVCAFSACCHVDMLDKGRDYFDCISKCYHITPTMELYGYMFDFSSCVGCLDKAWDFINNMPIEPNANVWVSFLGTCRIHNNVELAKRALEHIFEARP